MDLRYRTIAVRIWQDDKWRELSDDGRLVLYMLLTHRDTNRLGVFVGRAATLAVDWPGDWETDRMSRALDELVRADMLRVDVRRGIIWIRNFLKYHPPHNPNIVRSWIRDADDVQGTLRTAVLDAAESVVRELGSASLTAFRTAFPERVSNDSGTTPKLSGNDSETIREPSRKQDQDQDQELKETKDTHRARVRENDSGIIPESFPESSAVNSATNDEQTTTKTTNGRAPVDGKPWGEFPTRRRRAGMAWEAIRPGLSVPQHLHDELLSRMGSPDEDKLRRFYVETEKRFEGLDIPDDIHAHYRREFKIWIGTSAAAAPSEDPVKRAARLTMLRRSRIVTS